MLSTKAIIGILSFVIILIAVAAAVSITLIVKKHKKTNEIMKSEYAKLSNKNKMLSDSLVRSSTPVSSTREQKPISKNEIDYIMFKDTQINVALTNGEIITPEPKAGKLIFPQINKEYAAIPNYSMDPAIVGIVYILQELNASKDKYDKKFVDKSFMDKYYSLYNSTSLLIDLYANYILIEEASKKGMTKDRLLNKAVDIFRQFSCDRVYKDQFDKQFDTAKNKIDAFKHAVTAKIGRGDQKSEPIDNLISLLNEYTNVGGEYAFNLKKVIDDIERIKTEIEKGQPTKDNTKVEEQVTKDSISALKDEEVYEN